MADVNPAALAKTAEEYERVNNYIQFSVVHDGVRVQIHLAGQPRSWIVFETAEQAYGALRGFAEQIAHHFGPDPIGDQHG